MSDDFSFDDDDNAEQVRKLSPEEELARLVVRSQQGPDPSPTQTNAASEKTGAIATAPSNGGTAPETASSAVTSVAIAPSPPLPAPPVAPTPQRQSTAPTTSTTATTQKTSAQAIVPPQTQVTVNTPATIQHLTKISEIIRALILQNPRNPSALSIAIDWIRRDPLGEHNGITYQALLELRLADLDVILMAVRWLTEHYDHHCSARIVEMLSEYTAGK